jgi:hypothetical protein
MTKTEIEIRLADLEARVAHLENERTRVRTWDEVIWELELLVPDVQVSGISDALKKLAKEEGTP